MPKSSVKVAAVGDVHCTRTSHGLLQTAFANIADHADILLLCGDLTEHGLPEEAQILAKELTTAVKVPILAVLGNHDYESGKQEEVKNILNDSGVRLMDGEAFEMNGIAFSGVKGFIGGFGRWALAAWGEETIKKIVHEAVEEALKLESAMARANTEKHVVFMHYSPIQKTVEGEAPEIYPYLGSSRLEEPLTRYDVAAVFHGHAHKGTPEGRTTSGVPVYNVALPLLRSQLPGSPAYRVLEVAVPPQPAIAHVEVAHPELINTAPAQQETTQAEPVHAASADLTIAPPINMEATIDPNAQTVAKVTLTGHE